MLRSFLGAFGLLLCLIARVPADEILNKANRPTTSNSDH